MMASQRSSVSVTKSVASDLVVVAARGDDEVMAVRISAPAKRTACLATRKISSKSKVCVVVGVVGLAMVCVCLWGG